MRKSPTASVIILCHNDGHYLKQCLRSVFENTDVSHEIILIDNASADGSGKYLKTLSRRPEVTLIRNTENRFFAGGNNQGIAVAKGRYVVLLNADAVVGPGWLRRMIAVAEKDAGIGLVAPHTNSAAGPQLIRHAVYDPAKDFQRFAGKWALDHRGRTKNAHRLIAFCLLIKRELIDKIGVLDERFGPGGYEDYDYCLRARQAGYKTVVAQEVFVHHYGGKGYSNMDYDYHRRVNREILARKWSRFAFYALDEMDPILAGAA
ncbi:MAG: glycosyltransferase family 2 protein [Elusimicrobiota bacterium]